MGSTNAERQRRYRAHKRGDHSLCDSQRCSGDVVTSSPVTVVTRNADPGDGPRQPLRLRVRGKRLWQQLVVEGAPSPLELALIEEACRLADRLDRLDAIVSGEDRAWLKLEFADDGVEITVVVDKLLSEARQQQLALKQILAELRQSQSATGVGGKRTAAPAAAPAGQGGGGGGVTDLAARIAAKRSAQTAG